MATNKCSYLIHSLNKKTRFDEWFNLKLGNDILKQEKIDLTMKFLKV